MKKYYVSKLLWIPFVVAFSGCFILCLTLVDYILFSNRKPVDGKGLLSLPTGRYVEISFDEMLLNAAGYPAEGVMFYATGNYGRFLFPVDDTCVHIEFAANSNSLEDLRELREGGRKKITILARSIPSDEIQVDLSEFPHAEGKVLTDVVLREITEGKMAEKVKYGVIVGFGILAVAVGLLFTSVGIHKVQDDEPFEKSKRYFETKASFNKEADLERLLKKKEELKNKQARMKLWIGLYILIATVAFIEFLKLLSTFEQAAPVFVMVIMTVVFFWSVIQAWKALLNSEWSPALSISKKFSVNSIPVKLEETSILIGVLKRLINEEMNHADKM